jgi:hypothetical protein
MKYKSGFYFQPRHNIKLHIFNNKEGKIVIFKDIYHLIINIFIQLLVFGGTGDWENNSQNSGIPDLHNKNVSLKERDKR